MSALKDFFNKMKKDKKFRDAGPGHSLQQAAARTSDRPAVDVRPTDSQQAVSSSAGRPPQPSSDSNQKAAQAALARLEQRMGGLGKNTNLLKEVFTEMGYSKVEVEAGAAAGPSQPVRENEAAGLPSLAVEGVFYRCPVIGPFVLPRDEMERKIQEFLKEQEKADPTIASAVMLATFNKDAEKLQAGRDILDRYLGNIIKEPGEEKYRKIRIGNRVFQEKVMSLNCADRFLEAAGFQKIPMPVDDKDEDFYVLFPDHVDTEKLSVMRDYLMQAEPVVAELDRGLRVFRPTGAVAQFNLPDEFFDRSAQEVQDEYKRRMEELDKSLTLRTKAMREREQQQGKPARKYRFTVLRIRLGGLILQGTFGAYEKVAAVEEWLKECLVNPELPFSLTTAVGNKLDKESRLMEVDLVPAAVLNFHSGLPLPPGGSAVEVPFLKEEVLALAIEGVRK
ncbi:UBX domain-containing protein 6-like [Paramacrobiotus metropolitanus]|uniref:UBX domain-containing protein 6-like n=1 Tax=Paramacrobiotus metropolitanus TaxID=2943436 RepID=UPI00244634A8|nr:UBX domain-containing protein 6-like [Paramacrobiotus metropolitanus]